MARPTLSRLMLLGTLLAAPRLASAAGEAATAPLRTTGQAFGVAAAVEVRDLARPAAERALAAAWGAIHRGEAALGELTSDSARRPVKASPELFALLRRADDFCRWSDGAVSPLGGAVFALWGLRRPVAALPAPDLLESAAASAACERWRLDLRTSTVTLDAGSTLELWSFERGWAVDQAVAALAAAGTANAWVEIGGIVRATGAGPQGRGWRFAFPISADPAVPPDAVRLVDQAAAMADAGGRPLEVAGERFAPYLDLRTGRPVTGVARAVAVTSLAVDAQALSTAMFVFGPSAGALRLGSLRPKPSVLWLLGEGQGAPVFSTANWSAVKKW